MVSWFADLWRSFDAVGRRAMPRGNPVLGSSSVERKILEEAARQREAKDKRNG